MNLSDWWRLPLTLKLATLIAGVFFNQRFDSIGHNPILPGLVIRGTPKHPIYSTTSSVAERSTG